MYDYVGNDPMNAFDPLGLCDADLMKPGKGTGLETFNPKGVYSVLADGSPTSIIGPANDSLEITPQQLAHFILNQPGYTPGTPVLLFMCNTGAPGGTFAAGVSSELGSQSGVSTTVIAPSTPAWFNQSGFIGAFDEEPWNPGTRWNMVPGVWNSFKDGKLQARMYSNDEVNGWNQAGSSGCN